MRNTNNDRSVDEVRRKLLRSSIIASGAFALGHVPYSRPETKSFFGIRSAYAQPSVVTTITCSFTVTPNPGTGQACQNSVIQTILAQVTPTPPVGTLLRCTPTTNDPLNSTLPTTTSTTAPTDAAGSVMFAQINLTGNVPNPPLALGSILTMTVAFDNQAAFGTASCSNQLTIVACP